MSNRSLAVEPNQHSIVATCTFNAPRDLVYKAMTDPEMIRQWWGPRGLKMTIEKLEPWAGGSWRYIVDNERGRQWCFHGVYHNVEELERTVFTYEYETLPGHTSLETVVFEDHEGGTKVVTTSVFQSVEDRDARVVSDMEEGEEESMDQLEELLAEMLAHV
jgi:uncharacterized protein YndB with AHSA1/START domain